MSRAERHHVSVEGRESGPTVLLLHGFGCDRSMWRRFVPFLAEHYRVVSYDQAGAGSADPSLYDVDRHSSLDGYAEDVVSLCEDLGLTDVVVVGHSVSAMIGMIAHLRAPTVVTALVMLCPSPRYIDDLPDYAGGFSEADIDELLASIDANYLGWAGVMAPVIMGRPDEPAFGQELTSSFCRTDPDVARRFAEVTFRSDTRALLPSVTCPTLVVQTRQDAIAGEAVGRYVAEAIPGSGFTLLEATGHCPQLSAPEETATAVLDFLADVRDGQPA
jgi:sigma-B regulation protein RsbQ